MKIFLLSFSAFLLVNSAVLAQEDVCTTIKDRVDCHPDSGANIDNCHARGCSWCEAEAGVPWCHTKDDHGYLLESVTPTPEGYTVKLKRASNATYFGEDAEELFAYFEFQSNDRLRIKVTTAEPRFEVPLQVNPPAAPSSDPLYEVDFGLGPLFNFKVVRKSSRAVLLDTSLGGLTFENQFIQFATRLPTTNVYGIGENEQSTFKHTSFDFTTYALYAKDAQPSGRTNLYGVMPHYTVLENDGSAHSVVIVNSNAQEFELTPAPGIVYRTIGGVLDIYVFLGPTPEETVQQSTLAFGRHSIPPYWSLGFQLCRWGYDNLENMDAAIRRTREAGIPQDIQYGDIDIMDRKLDFTYDPINFPNFPEYVSNLKKDGIKFIPIVDPGIAFEGLEGQYKALDLGNELDVWVKRPDGTPVVGAVWPGNTYFPDFSKNVTLQYWTELLKDFKELLDYDALWIDMNEVASWGEGDILQGCESNSVNKPPYMPAIRDGDLSAGTICPDAVQEYGINYNTHSLYGWKESEITNLAMRAATGKRGAVLSRSTFIGSGRWATHWLGGDNFANWSNMQNSIIAMLQYNVFGLPFVGADICGFNGETTLNLCRRWQQLGAFYPFSRNHNAIGVSDQDPGVWPEVAEATRKALEVKYTLMPTLYTLFYLHRTMGNTVVRALWHEFPQDTTASSIDKQFLWGSGILVSPVLEEFVETVDAYFPPAARWFDYYTGSELKATGQQTLEAPLDHINVHVRGGGVYPTQKAELNTVLARQNPFGLIVALDESGNSKGQLYVDDGDSIEPQDSGLYFLAEYDVSSRALTSKVVNNGYSAIEGQLLDNVRLIGAGSVTAVTVNGVPHTDFTQVGEETKITSLNLPVNSEFTISF